MYCYAINRKYDLTHQHVLLIELVTNQLEFPTDLSLHTECWLPVRLILWKHGALDAVRTGRRCQQQ